MRNQEYLSLVFRHSARREPLLEARAHRWSVQTVEISDGSYRGRLVLHDEAGKSVFNHFRDRAAIERDHRSATAHCFDHHQTEWLRPVDRHQQANGAGEKGRFIAVADLPDHLNAWTIQHRPYHPIEEVLVGLVHLSSDP